MKFGLLIIAHEYTQCIEYVAKISERFGIKIILHIDAKTDISKFPSTLLEKVILTDKRVTTEWGTFSQVETMLELISKGRSIGLDMMQFISGDTLPVRRINEIYDFYERHLNNSFMTISELPITQERRIKFIFKNGKPNNFLGKVLNKFRNKFNLYKKNPNYSRFLKDGKLLYWGSTWFCINAEIAKYILDYVRNNQEFVDAFKRGLCVDELFFHTILGNSPLIKHNINSPTMWVNFVGNNPSPQIIETDNINFVNTHLKDHIMFARKISKKIDLNSWLKLFDLS